MQVAALEAQLLADFDSNRTPFLVAATAGTVSTGSVDPLPAIAALCKRHGLWFHVDGAYGAPAASLPEASDDLRGLRLADSVALDPHKWLYSPLEAGCALVRNPEHLTGAFSFRPEYYHFHDDAAEPRINYYEYGIQNSRGFRALKVWLTLRAIGRVGYIEMLQQDIALARRLFEAVAAHAEIEAHTQHLSITTFRYRPPDLQDADDETETYLNELNEKLLSRLQSGGEAYVSNAVLDGRMLLRACIVNFRTAESDIDALPEIVVRQGRALDRELRATRSGTPAS
jgi:glutamate/tyrosine decarboxylase-like PLP-dependent enzyme